MSVAVEGPRAIMLRDDDNVAVAARPIPRGAVLDLQGRSVEVREPIGLGHKVALSAIAGRRSRAQVRPDHRFRVPADRTRLTRPRGEPPRGPLRAGLCLRRRSSRTAHAGSPPHVPGLSSARRPRRHAELRRRDQHRELLGQHLAVRRRSVQATEPGARTSPTSTASSPSRTRAAAGCRSRAPITGSWNASSPVSPTTRM